MAEHSGQQSDVSTVVRTVYWWAGDSADQSAAHWAEKMAM